MNTENSANSDSGKPLITTDTYTFIMVYCLYYVNSSKYPYHPLFTSLQIAKWATTITSSGAYMSRLPKHPRYLRLMYLLLSWPTFRPWINNLHICEGKLLYYTDRGIAWVWAKIPSVIYRTSIHQLNMGIARIYFHCITHAQYVY